MRQKHPSWPRQAAVIVSQSRSFASMVEQQLRTLDWRLTYIADDAGSVKDLIRDEIGYLIIVDDSSELPSPLVVRSLLADPTTLLTPILCFLSETRAKEAALLEQIAPLEVVNKPLIPAIFLHKFKNLVKRYETSLLIATRKANYLGLNASPSERIGILDKLVPITQIRHLATAAIALNLIQSGKGGEAERILLETIRGNPGDILAVLTLGYTYMRCGMPHHAARLFHVISKKYPDSNLCTSDLVQSDLLMGALDAAFDQLDSTQRQDYLSKQMTSIEAQLLLTRNRPQEAKKLCSPFDGLYLKLHTDWFGTPDKQRRDK